MPKTTKRLAAKRAARIARAHATELPRLEVPKESPIRRSPGYKAPARGIARYPWGTSILALLIVGLGIFMLYSYHIGPFALKPAVPHALATAKALPTATMAVQNAASPCMAPAVLKEITNTSAAPSAADSAKISHSYSNAPAMSIDTGKTYCAGFNTSRGEFVVELDPKIAPLTVNNFVFLAQHQFYDGLTFHRVIPAADPTGPFIAQGGDPKGDGTGGPGYKFNDEKVQGEYTEGTLAMANSGANTNGSQFFINTADNSKGLAKSYNLFGHIVGGLNIAKAIQGPNPGGDATAKAIKPDVMNRVVVVAAP